MTTLAVFIGVADGPNRPYPATWLAGLAMFAMVSAVFVVWRQGRTKEFWGLIAFSAIAWGMVVLDVA